MRGEIFYGCNSQVLDLVSVLQTYAPENSLVLMLMYNDVLSSCPAVVFVYCDSLNVVHLCSL